MSTISKCLTSWAKQSSGLCHHSRNEPAAINGVWYMLWTGCQWKAIHKDWFGVSSSLIGERFQTLREVGSFAAVMREMVVHYQTKRGIGVEECPIPGELRHPARRWVVEHTLGWLCKRRSLRVHWCKKSENWLALIQLACAHILLMAAIFG